MLDLMKKYVFYMKYKQTNKQYIWIKNHVIKYLFLLLFLLLLVSKYK